MVWKGWAILLAVIPMHAAGTYVGAAACAKCHEGAHKTWSQSRHSKMLQPATAQGVKGDFARGRVVLRGKSYTLLQRAGAYYIRETYLTGKTQEHHIDYTLGNRRIQHYLTTLPDGRVILLPPTWDVRRKQWFHNLDIDDPEEVPGVQVQLWNKSCYSCHVSREEKNFNLEKIEYKTSWLDFGINCERCHAPGSDHAAKYATSPPAPGADSIVTQSRLDPMRNTSICAQCHSFRDIYQDGFTAGSDYYDHFLPVLDYGLPTQEDPAYWPDGRTRRFSNDAFGLWMSKCFMKGGATCLSCHAVPHNTDIDKNPQLRPDGNAICGQCHAALEKSVASHSHHAAKSAGSSCVECHMPRSVISIKAEIRDHSMTVPVPENTIRHKIPNACNYCHKEKTPQWAAAQIKQWYGHTPGEKLILRADAFTEGRNGDPDAVPKLLAILGDAGEDHLTRANAAGHLGRFSPYNARAYSALRDALADREALVRAVAVLSIRATPSQRPEVIAAVTRLLGDPVNIVRVAALVGLVSLGVRQLPGEDGERFERVKRVYEARAQLNSDDAEQQVAVGKFFYLAGDMARAKAAFQDALRLNPEYPLAQQMLQTLARQAPTPPQ